ncbi:ATP-binding protein [Virgibacillus necropolis]|uniref:ATP-binding protein n=1 Tax=Virgibacillus necropolis TaxID=163877 RepID=UPI0038516D21
MKSNIDHKYEYDYEYVSPEATSVVESMRSIGYNLETALSDIIDNSISAHATEVKINFYWDETNSYIRIEDNGIGMNEKDLVQAMKLGSRSPLENREVNDLGRFGMGLKTASFSQSRRLTVKSKAKENFSYIRCWDLDTIQDTRKWTLLKNPKDEQSLDNLSGFLLGNKTGTIVLLEELDRVIASSYSKKNYNAFLSKINKVEKHLCMVYHRFLTGYNSIKITINGRQLASWDPYLLDQDTTQELLEEPFQDGEQIVKISVYVLPHHSKLSKEEYEKAEGPKGWNNQQGFYIYRNKRLLVAGSWLGLFKKEEPYKLARIMIDITSESDFNWQIDIKKSVARPPQNILQELKRIGNLGREASYKVYFHRGTKLFTSKKPLGEYTHLWEQVYKHGKSFYKLNRDHPLLLKIYEDLTSDKKLLSTYLSLVEENLPVNIMPSQSVKVGEENSYKNLLSDDERSNLMQGMKDFIYAMRQINYGEEDILYKLKNIEPYKHYPDLITGILEE